VYSIADVSHNSLRFRQGFTRFVQNGRVCLVNYGPDAGKLVTIVDVVDQNRCVVYGPTSGVARQMIGYKRLSLTDLKIAIGRGARKGSVEKAWTEFDVEGKWAATGWGKKQAARKAKASSNDFERFKTMVAKKKINEAARKATA